MNKVIIFFTLVFTISINLLFAQTDKTQTDKEAEDIEEILKDFDDGQDENNKTPDNDLEEEDTYYDDGSVKYVYKDGSKVEGRIKNYPEPSPKMQKIYDNYHKEEAKKKGGIIHDHYDPFQDETSAAYHMNNYDTKEARKKRNKREIEKKVMSHAKSRTRDFRIRNGHHFTFIKTSATKKGLKEVLKGIGTITGTVAQMMKINVAVGFFWSSSIALAPDERMRLFYDAQTAADKINFYTLGDVYFKEATTEERDIFDGLWKIGEYEKIDILSNKIYTERVIIRRRSNITPKPKSNTTTKEVNRTLDFQHNYVPSGSPPPPRPKNR